MPRVLLFLVYPQRLTKWQIERLLAHFSYLDHECEVKGDPVVELIHKANKGGKAPVLFEWALMSDNKENGPRAKILNKNKNRVMTTHFKDIDKGWWYNLAAFSYLCMVSPEIDMNLFMKYGKRVFYQDTINWTTEKRMAYWYDKQKMCDRSQNYIQFSKLMMDWAKLYDLDDFGKEVDRIIRKKDLSKLPKPLRENILLFRKTPKSHEDSDKLYRTIYMDYMTHQYFKDVKPDWYCTLLWVKV